MADECQPVTCPSMVLGQPIYFQNSHFYLCSYVTCQIRSKCFTLILDDFTKTHWHLILIILCDAIGAHLVSKTLHVPGIFQVALKIIYLCCYHAWHSLISHLEKYFSPVPAQLCNWQPRVTWALPPSSWQNFKPRIQDAHCTTLSD